jgi:hypothetical protein
MLCRRNSQKDVSLQRRQRGANDAHACSTGNAWMAAFRLQTRGPSTLYSELRGCGVDIEGASGYFPHPPRRLQRAAECKEMRCSNLRG